MADKRTPVIAGLGGAALAVAMFAGGGHPTGDTKTAPSAKVESSSLNVVQSTTNDNGPWYAFCREYATTAFDHGKDPSDEPGVKGHRMPHEADEGTVEVTRPVGRETEKFSVKNHVVGDLPTCVPPGSALRIMIATVPDPNMTQMELDFDRDINAIQAAAAAEDYTYTRYWFPWRPNNWAPEKGSDPETEERRRDEPGILCFRKSSGPQSIAGGGRLFIFLVGETPTSGANRLQLSHALYYWQQLRDKGDVAEPDASRLGISGPHFSASFPVLEDILADAVYKTAQPQQAPILDFVSPDASGQGFIDHFSTYCNGQVPRRGAAPCILHALSIESNDADSIAINYLASLHYDSTHIALLEEDESAFSVERFRTPSNADRSYALSLRFPRDLSSLRSLSDIQSEQIAESGSKYLSLPQGSPLARLSARQPTERDTPESYATEQEAAEAARVLADDIEEMRSNRIQAIVVAATNPLDRIYLLEYLHDQLPDLRTVTIDADELELGSPHFIDLTGTIAVTALPTLPDLVAGDNPGSHLSFRSSRQQGEFLAVRTLLVADRDPKIGQAFDERLNPCYTISIVGQSGFRLMPYESQKRDVRDPKFPCSVSTSSGRKTLPGTFTTVEKHADIPGSFLAFLFIVVLFNASHLWSWLNSLRHIEGVFSYPRQLGPQLEPRRLYLLFVVNNQLFLLNLLAWRAAHALWISTMGGSHGIWFALLYSAFFVLLPVSAPLAVIFSVGFFKQPIGPGAADIGQFAIAALYLLTTGLMIWFLPAFSANIPVFFERVTLLGEGLSPLLPITGILVAYFFWGTMQLKRLEWIYCRRIDLGPQLEVNNDMLTRFDTAMKRAEALSPQEGMIQVGGLIFCSFGALFLWKSLKGFDGPYFHTWLAWWGFIGLLLIVILACYQAWSIWDGVRNLLERLEMTPIREAFQKIGDDGVVKINIWDFTSQRRSFTVLDATVQSIERIYGAESAPANSARSKLSDFIAADYRHLQVDPDQIDSLNDLMNVHMAVAMQSLASSPVADYIPQSQIYLALRLVAFVRYAMLQIMTLLGFVASGYVLAALSVMFYPFAGRKTLAELLTLTFVVLLILLGLMMVQFGKNAMLSRLEGSAPGEVSYWQVALHLLTMGGLPLLAVATTQFPALGQFVFSLLRPVLGTLH